MPLDRVKFEGIHMIECYLGNSDRVEGHISAVTLRLSSSQLRIAGQETMGDTKTETKSPQD
jgi:hypothetical protein